MFIRTARKLAKALPILLAIGATSTTPALANQGSGDERGERPQRETLYTHSLMRMSRSALRELRYTPASLTMDGVMGPYNARLLVWALLAKPEPTKQLIQRLESAPNEAARLEIAHGLLKVYDKRYRQNESLIDTEYRRLISEGRIVNRPFHSIAGNQESSDPDVQNFYQLQDERRALAIFMKLLANIATPRRTVLW